MADTKSVKGIKVKDIVIEIGDREIALTIEEGRKISDALSELFGEEKEPIRVISESGNFQTRLGIGDNFNNIDCLYLYLTEQSCNSEQRTEGA